MTAPLRERARDGLVMLAMTLAAAFCVVFWLALVYAVEQFPW